MKRKTQLFTFLLAALMILSLLSACAQQSPAAESKNDTAVSDTEALDSGADASENTELTEIYFSFLDMNGLGDEGWARILDAINAITEPELGITCHVRSWDFGSYSTQVTLAISGGEQLDVMNIIPLTPLSTLLSQNMLMECGDLLRTYAPDAMQTLGSAAETYTYNGGLYGLPTNRLWGTNEYIILRRDILEACDLVEKAETCSSWSELEEIYAGVYDYCQAQGIAVVCGSKAVAPYTATWTDDTFASGKMFDRLADSTTTIAAFDGRVSLFWENEDVIQMLKRVNGWNENGWIYPDSIFGTSFNDDLMRDGMCFSYISDTEIGVESQKLNATGYECICPMAYQGMIVTSTLVNMGVAIPVTAQEPEAAAKFINALYTNSDLINILAWGIEGEDYIINDSGEACYPESGAGAYHAGDYLIGNQMNVIPWEGNGADFRERAKEANESAEITPYLGFMIDTEGMDTLVASLSAVTDQYKPTLLCGQYTDELAAEYVSRLQEAGLDEYISAVQQQLDAFLQEQ